MNLRTRDGHTGGSRRPASLAATLGVGLAVIAMAWSMAGDASGQPAAPLGSVVSVRDFRAVGDGATDDTAAIKQALAAALRSRGTFDLPPGTYLISDTLTVTDTVAFVGSGWGSVLVLKDGVRRIMILVQGASPSGETVGFQASNLVLDGGRGGQLDAGLLQINSAVGFVVDHLWVRNGGRAGESRSQGVAGISVAGKSLASTVASRGVVMNSLIEATTKPGVVWSTHATDGTISGNIVRGLRGNSLTPCLAVSEGRNVSLTSNSVSECEGAGISIANGGHNVAPLHAIVANNHVYANGTGAVEGNGIQVVNAFPDRNAFVQISGNVVYENRGAGDGHGIMVQNVDHAVVSGNIVRHNKRSGIVLYNVTGALVEGNYVYGNNTLGTPEHRAHAPPGESRARDREPRLRQRRDADAGLRAVFQRHPGERSGHGHEQRPVSEQARALARPRAADEDSLPRESHDRRHAPRRGDGEPRKSPRDHDEPPRFRRGAQRRLGATAQALGIPARQARGQGLSATALR